MPNLECRVSVRVFIRFDRNDGLLKEELPSVLHQALRHAAEEVTVPLTHACEIKVWAQNAMPGDTEDLVHLKQQVWNALPSYDDLHALERISETYQRRQ